ncbi:MAG TPA: hypothetical protein VH280_14885 [Verrucomicrobiae bacterium]|jgi:hypothetical protein|nr:hypothetical protein [Verrucomicrobiae bacterium]
MTPITITIPAATNGNGIKNYNVRGKYFLTKSTTGEFLVQVNRTGSIYDFSQPGDGFGNENSPEFSILLFSNAGGTAVTVTFYASVTPIHSPAASLTSTVTATATLTNTLTSCAPETEGAIQVNYAGSGAVRFAAPGNYWRRIIVIAQSSLDRAANAGKVYIGNSVSHQPLTLNPGDVWSFEADTGGKRDFGSWYVTADNSGDGVSVLYV